ncbi:MAG: AcvB/VirJ family lysyl-phosphatidylglycerol hydrolase [Gemmatimonadales bacterium]
MIATLMLTLLATRAEAAALRFGRFGEIAVYRPAGTPARTALFFSGDGGWNAGVVDMAHALAQGGTLVLGVDTPRYLKAVDASAGPCTYLAGDAEALSQYAQKELGLPRYQPPLLVGYSSGAGLAYATLAQAPANTFTGALSIGFDPHLPTRTALCGPNGLTTVATRDGASRVVQPVAQLPEPWIILHGDMDQVWPADSAEAFVRQVPGATIVRLPKVGHGFSVEGAWIRQLKDAVTTLTPADTASPLPSDLGDLPVVTLPLPGTPRGYFAIVLSGDGGWAGIDKQIGEELVRAGVPTVGFNSLQYFWRKRTPEGASSDLERLIRHYQQAFGREHLILVGYSRGADVLPLMASRLPARLLDQIRLLAFLGIEHETNLEFRLGDWLGAQHDAAYKLLPELQKLAGHPMLCVYGAHEGDTLCPDLPPGLMEVVELHGGHHFDGDFPGLARLIMSRVP